MGNNNSCIIGEEEVPHAFQLDFGLCFQSREIKELSILSSPKIDTFCCSSKGVLQHDSKKDPEQGQHEDAALFHSALDVKGI